MEFVNLRTRKNIELKNPPLVVLIYLAVLIVLLCSFILFAIKVKKLLLHPLTWFSVSLIVYFICTSGTIYDIIHNVPFAYYNPQDERKVEYIARENRS